MALQHRRIILQLVHVDDAPLGEPGSHAKAHRILPCRPDKKRIGRAVRWAIGIASWERLLLEKYAGARKTEPDLIHEGIAEGARPIQANLLAQSGNILIVTHIDPVTEVNATVERLLVDVAGKKVILIAQLEVDSSRGFIIVKRAGYEARDLAELNGSAAVRARTSCRAWKRDLCGRINLVCHQHILQVGESRIARGDCIGSNGAFNQPNRAVGESRLQLRDACRRGYKAGRRGTRRAGKTLVLDVAGTEKPDFVFLDRAAHAAAEAVVHETRNRRRSATRRGRYSLGAKSE